MGLIQKLKRFVAAHKSVRQWRSAESPIQDAKGNFVFTRPADIHVGSTTVIKIFISTGNVTHCDYVVVNKQEGNDPKAMQRQG